MDPVTPTRRGDERRSCQIDCRVETVFGKLACTLLNISPGGAGLRLQCPSPLPMGLRMVFLDGPLAGISGVARWSGHPRYGLSFDSRCKADPRIISLYETCAPAR